MGPIGRLLRLVLGAYLLLLGLPYYLFPGMSVSFLGNTYSSSYVTVVLASGVTLGFFAFYLVIHRASTTMLRNLNMWWGAALANIPPLGVFVISAFLGLGFAQIAVFTYVGVAMLMAGWRKDDGCEVLSPANAFLGKKSHFACIVFSPIDWAEKKAKQTKTNSLAPQLGFKV